MKLGALFASFSRHGRDVRAPDAPPSDPSSAAPPDDPGAVPRGADAGALDGGGAPSPVPDAIASPATPPTIRAATPAGPIPSRPDLILTPFLANTDVAVSFADPSLPDEPLTHVNDAFCDLTGHPRERCVGRNCRFLQGPKTRRSDVETIRRGIDEDHYLVTRLLNYRRNGELFDNVLQLGQLRDTSGDTRFLFGLQWDVTRTLNLLGGSTMEAELEDRTLSPQLRQLARFANHLVRRSTSLGVGAAGVPMVERLVAMSRPYQFPTIGARRDRATLRAMLDYLLEPHLDLEGARLRVRGTDGTFSADVAGPTALWLHELASASRQYGALSQPSGIVVLSWGFPKERGRPMIAFNWHEMALGALPGAGRLTPFTAENRTGGNGARVVRDVIEFAGGRSVLRERDGVTDATLVLPNDGAD